MGYLPRGEARIRNRLLGFWASGPIEQAHIRLNQSPFSTSGRLGANFALTIEMTLSLSLAANFAPDSLESGK